MGRCAPEILVKKYPKVVKRNRQIIYNHGNAGFGLFILTEHGFQRDKSFVFKPYSIEFMGHFFL